MREPCTVEGCGRLRQGRGLCGMHYQRAQKGKPLDAPRHGAQKGQPCGIEGCSGVHYARGLCIMHYDRLRRLGDPGEPERRRGRPGEGSVDPYGYRVLKMPDHPLARAQGKVSEHRVVLYEKVGPGLHPCHWCGRTLAWELDPGDDPQAKLCADHVDENRLNNDPANLVPACIACNTNRASVA